MKKDIVIILGTAHLGTSPGKCSPDGKFREAVYSRQMVEEIAAILQAYGYRVVIDYEPLEPNAQMAGRTPKERQNKELAYRKNKVNALCDKYGKNNCIYVSVHVNGIGNDGKWHDDRGWCVYTSPGKTKSDDLATCIWKAADKNLPHDHKYAIRSDWSDKDPDFEAALYVLTKTACPAVLTENFFQDNREDVAYLNSDEGHHAIERLHVEGIIDYINKFMS